MKLLNIFANLLNAAPNTSDTVSEAAKEGMGWHPEEAIEMLNHMGIGMLVIFVIIGVIIAATVVLGKITSGKK